MVVGTVVQELALPVYLDTLGTMVTAILTGASGGLVVGTITNVLSGLLRGYVWIAFTPIQWILAVVAAGVPDVARRLAAAFWPGPLTLVLPRGEHIPDTVTAGGHTVAVRMPRHPVALALIRAAGVPVAAPSARSAAPAVGAIPEPSTYGLIGATALIGFALWRRTRLNARSV